MVILLSIHDKDLFTIKVIRYFYKRRKLASTKVLHFVLSNKFSISKTVSVKTVYSN